MTSPPPDYASALLRAAREPALPGSSPSTQPAGDARTSPRATPALAPAAPRGAPAALRKTSALAPAAPKAATRARSSVPLRRTTYSSRRRLPAPPSYARETRPPVLRGAATERTRLLPHAATAGVKNHQGRGSSSPARIVFHMGFRVCRRQAFLGVKEW